MLGSWEAWQVRKAVLLTVTTVLTGGLLMVVRAENRETDHHWEGPGSSFPVSSSEFVALPVCVRCTAVLAITQEHASVHTNDNGI